MAGSDYEDIVFGDGSGGGAGSVITSGNNNAPGKGGGAADSISSGAGNDILFGDGFSGSFQSGSSPTGTNGGYGGGCGNNRTSLPAAFGKAGIGGGDGYNGVILAGETKAGFASTVGHSRTGVAGSDGTSGDGGGGGVSAIGLDDNNTITAGLDPQIYNKVMTDLVNPNIDIFNQVMGNGDDTIVGGAGNDWIMGGFGNDLITGGSGNDMMWGRGGTSTITKNAYSYVDGTASTPETARFSFMPTDTLSAGHSLSVAGLNLTASRDLNGEALATALSSISVGGTGSSVADSYSFSGNLTDGWFSNAVTNPLSPLSPIQFHTVKFQTIANGNVSVNPPEMTASKTTFNMTDNDTFTWNTGDASAGSLSTDTLKDFKALDGSSGDSIHISDLLRGAGLPARFCPGRLGEFHPGQWQQRSRNQHKHGRRYLCHSKNRSGERQPGLKHQLAKLDRQQSVGGLSGLQLEAGRSLRMGQSHPCTHYLKKPVNSTVAGCCPKQTHRRKWSWHPANG